MRCSPRLSWLVLALATGSALSAQGMPTLSAQERAAVQAALPQRESQAKQRVQSLRQEKGLGEAHAFRLNKSHVDEFGETHSRFDQYFQGVKVWGAQAITHQGLRRDLNQGFRKETLALQENIQLNTRPTLDEKEVLALVHAHLNPKGAYDVAPKAELVIYPETRSLIRPYRSGKDGAPNAVEVDRLVQRHRLAYHVEVALQNSQDPLAQRDYLVDAHTGRIIAFWSSLQTAEPAKGTGKSQYSGSVELNATKLTDGTFELRDLTRANQPHPVTGEVGNAIYDKQNGGDGAGLTLGTIYKDADNAWGDGQNYLGSESANDNGQTAAVDAAFGLQATWDYFKNIHGRAGIDGKGTSIAARVHLDKKFVNAFWYKGCYCMSFGDGDADTSVLTAPDVAAHELGHGFNNESANLIYKNESGGINEANSDIIGTMVEFYMRGGNLSATTIPDEAPGANWTMGEQMSAKPLRYMYKPSLDDLANKFPDQLKPLQWGYYSPDEWSPRIATLDVHLSSGPMNRAFYFLSQGADTSEIYGAPKYLPKGMKGIGNTNAARIWFRAMTAYLTPMSDYRETREACMQAARDIADYQDFKGQPITQADALKAVQNAFAGINVGWNADQEGGDTLAPKVVSCEVLGEKGQVAFKVKATDNVRVGLVEYWVDGLPFGNVTTPDAEGHFTLNFDSSIMRNGAHELTLRVFDAAGNLTRFPAEGPTGKVFNLKNPIEQVLQDPGFEQGDWIWMHNQKLLFNPKYAHSGQAAAFLGDRGESLDSNPPADAPAPEAGLLFQKFQMPATGHNPKLSFWVFTMTEETEAKAKDELGFYLVDKNGSTIAQALGSLSNLDAPQGYVQKTFSIDPALMGQELFFLVEATEDAVAPTLWLLDDLSLTVEGMETLAPTVTGINPASALPGATVTLTGTNLNGVTQVEFNGTKAEFKVSGDGLIKAIVPAAATSGPVTVTTPQGKASSPAFTVLTPQPVQISVSPANVTLYAGHSQAFTATVLNTANLEVSWSVKEQGGGTIDAKGLYKAPDAPGTYTVVATSAADSKAVALATVAVKPLSLDLNGDGLLNSLDVFSLLMSYGKANASADFNGDGIVDDQDLKRILDDPKFDI